MPGQSLLGIYLHLLLLVETFMDPSKSPSSDLARKVAVSLSGVTRPLMSYRKRTTLARAAYSVAARVCPARE